MRLWRDAGLALALAWMGSGQAMAAQCDDLDWRSPDLPARRALTESDLVRLRDIGPANNELPDAPLFTLSPDGSRIAFQLRRANPQTNDHCLAMVVMALRADAAPVFVDRGGALLQFSMRMVGQSGIDTGIPMVITPRWSPDGTWISFLKRGDYSTQLWRASSDGHGSRALTGPEWNVVDFRIVDATHILVRFQDKSDKTAPENSREARVGFHYDDRFFPVASSMPVFAPPAPIQAAMLDLATGTSRLLPDPEAKISWDEADGQASPPADHPRLSRIAAPPGSAQMAISVTWPNGRSTVCEPQICGDIARAPWWNTAHDAVRFVRRTGWAKSRTEIAEWRPGKQRSKLLYSSEDYLATCEPGRGDQLVCLRETSLLPRHLVSIDLRQGSTRILADFNPEFAGLATGAVSRIRLRSAFGIEAFADVVLPVGYRPGHRYPLIVVQYTSRGFLRGGIGDEFPIQAYANHGYAVLSVQRPAAVGSLAHPGDWREEDRIGLKDFADRRSVLSVVEQGVRTLIDQGIVDPQAVGITGLSDGSSTVQFAALNSRLFSAGIASGCCWERGQDALLGLKAHALYRQIGWPSLIDPAPGFWAHISLAQNPDRVAFPILFDSSDDEFRAALESYAALRESGKPVDMFVFPDEHHVKWQPAHRLAAYQRSIDWFDFWLRGELPIEPERRTTALRWVALKDQSARSGDPASRNAIQ